MIPLSEIVGVLLISGEVFVPRRTWRRWERDFGEWLQKRWVGSAMAVPVVWTVWIAWSDFPKDYDSQGLFKTLCVGGLLFGGAVLGGMLTSWLANRLNAGKRADPAGQTLRYFGAAFLIGFIGFTVFSYAVLIGELQLPQELRQPSLVSSYLVAVPLGLTGSAILGAPMIALIGMVVWAYSRSSKALGVVGVFVIIVPRFWQLWTLWTVTSLK